MDGFVTKRQKEQTNSPAAKKTQNWPTTVRKYETAYIQSVFTAIQKNGLDYQRGLLPDDNGVSGGP